MSELLTAAQMRAIEQAAIDSGAVTGLELMERAGRGVVEAVFEEWPELAASPHRAVVLCGPGNNGGDGFVVARLLQEQGWQIEVFLYGDPEKLPPDARTNYERWCDLGDVTMRAINPPALMDDTLHVSGSFDLLVDAIFGTGLTRSFSGVFSMIAQAREVLQKRGVRVVAIDVPTGLCSDSGRALGQVIQADLTTTFHTRKPGHLIAEGPDLCGSLRCVDIGLSGLAPGSPARAALADLHGLHGDAGEVSRHTLFEVTGAQVAPFLGKRREDHKYSHGHALILTGGHGATGAARLAARGALRIGAGLVTLGVPPSASLEVAAQITAIMQRRVDGSEGLADVLQDPRFNAVCLGPGLGLERARALVPVALASGGVKPRPTDNRSVVLDADALSAFAKDPETLFEKLTESCVLTPHAGEFKRLFPDIAEKLDAPATKGPAYSKADATREAAARAGCTVLFKGPETVIADQTGCCSLNAAQHERAAPWLATAGSGDVLAGFITGLLARGNSPMQAAAAAAWLHVECALSFGPGLIAEDLPEELPKVFRTLGV